MKGVKTPQETVDKMRKMESGGMIRSQIAREIGTSPAMVTRLLGARNRKPANDNQDEPEAA